MQFLLLIYEQEKRLSGLPQAEFASELSEYGAFGQEFGAAIQAGNALQPTMTAKTVQVRNGKQIVVDGPLAETKEQLGGYYLVEAGNIDDALRIAAKIPAARYGSVEVRPVMTFS